MREELGLSQTELAGLFPPTSRGPRTKNWIAAVEAGRQEIKLAELPLFEAVLHADVRWLLTGEASGDTEFVARLRVMEGQMDGRGQREVLATAARQVEESQRRENLQSGMDSLKAALLAAGIDPRTVAAAEREAWRTLRAQDGSTEG